MFKFDFRVFFFSFAAPNMEKPHTSVPQTPMTGALRQRRSRSRSYRLSYRSCLGAASKIGQTPSLTSVRLNTSRKAPKWHNISDKVDAEHLALLMKTEWQLSYVTPLYRFNHAQLRSYARQLSAFISSEKQQGLAMEVGGVQNNFRASFTVVEGLAETEDERDTVFIQIHSKPVFAKPDEAQKSVWSGLLTCVNGNPEYLRSLPKDFACLPLFGSKGVENLSSSVKSWFQRTFDCSFGPLEINQTSMQWLAALWTDCHAQSNVQYLKTLWTVPAEPPLQINYTVRAQNAWALWRSVRADDAKEADSIDIEEVRRFIQGLKSHFHRHFQLDLSAGLLNQVSTAQGSAKSNGKIKISSSGCVIGTLTLLTECALLKMPI